MKRVYIVTVKADTSFDLSLQEVKEAIQECMCDNFGIEDGVRVEEDEEYV